MTTTFLVSYLGVHVIAAAWLVVSAVAMWRSRELGWVRGWHVVTRMLSVTFLGVTLLMVMPRHKAMFAGFGTELSGLTLLLLDLSDLAVSRIPELSVFVFLVLAAEATLFEFWLRHDGTVIQAKRCSTVATGGLTTFLLFCQLGVVMPLIKLWNDLQ